MKMKVHANRQSAVVEWNSDVTVHDLVLLIRHIPLSVLRHCKLNTDDVCILCKFTEDEM
jgi:hypothetical protein